MTDTPPARSFRHARLIALVVLLTVSTGHDLAVALGPDQLASRLQKQLAFIRRERSLTHEQQKTDALLRPYGWPALTPHRRRGAAPPASLNLPWRSEGRLRVILQVSGTASDHASALAAAGFETEIVNDRFGLVQGWIVERALPALARVSAVQSISPAWPPQHGAGAVTSEGDTASRANLARQVGYDGTGVLVGVISDGIDSLAASQATGDLGPVLVPPDPRCHRGSGDEGTAMLQIVHDLAPGATLLFSGPTTALEMVDTIACLASARAKVIVDDLFFFDQPFFEDGPIALAAATAVAAGSSYHTSAANYGDGKYLAENYRAGPDSFHDFDPGPGQNIVNRIVVAPHGLLQCLLQWADPFGGSGNDYDLLVVNPTSGNLLASSTNVQTGFQNPREIVAFVNPLSSPVLVGIVIPLFAGSTRALKLLCPDAPLEFSSARFGISGHAARPEVIAVAALDARDPGLDDVEGFSMQGPSPIFFPAPVTRLKPDLTAFDGVSTTLPAGGPFNPFFGTSAAAPHSAAVAALLLSKNAGLSPSQVQSILTATAVDIAAPGFDNVAGFGRIDALAAVNAVGITTSSTLPGCTPSGCDDANSCTDDSCDPSLGCQHAPNNVSCSDGAPCTLPDRCSAGQCAAGPSATAGTVSTLVAAGVNRSLGDCSGDKRSIVKKVTSPLIQAAKSFSLAEAAGTGTKKWTKKVAAGEKSIGTARSKLTKVQARLSTPCADDLGQAIAAGNLADACLR